MAKVRVYELAKELSIESKILVEKLVAGGMDIKNYMSTMDEQEIERARGIISGKISEVVVEKRIKSTVIRRRKKIKIKQDIPAVSAKEEEEERRDIVKEELLGKDELEKIDRMDDVEGIEDKELSAEEKALIAEKALEEGLSQKEEIEDARSGKTTGKEAEAKIKPKKIRKKKVERPAKIIKGPEEGPLSDILARKSRKKAAETDAKKPTAKKPLEPTREVTEKDKEYVSGKTRKGKKRKKEQLKIEEAVSRKSIRHRKKEIYEKADLYEGRPKKRKAKKGRKTREVVKNGKQTEITIPRASKRRIKVQDIVTVAELAKAMGIKAVELVRRLMGLGFKAKINQSIDFETASVVADEFGYELELDTFEEARLIAEVEDRPEEMEPRPPVVTIMGHVDHGKTSLLDYIRKSNIIKGESGGITQHIGAYHVETDSGEIVFLDTPGHEAFTAMRARGAKVTDIIVLVVAADDGVMPQTREAVNHARAANIPIIVAVNKIDKAEADAEKVKRELAELDLSPEEWGGDTLFGHVSAKTGDGVDEMLNIILLQSEILELKGNPKKAARGSVIEAALDRSKGPVATVLIKNGTLSKGDYFVCGEHYGRVRAMLDHRGMKMKAVGPSMPVELYGISGVPMAGDEFITVQDEKTAKQVIDHRKVKSEKNETVMRGIVSLDDLFERIKEGDVKEQNIVLKTDVQGSLEAIAESLVKQSTDEVKLKIIHSATGAVTESDIMLASASGAIIIGFNVRTNQRVKVIAEKENVDIRYYDVIYNVVKDVRLAMEGLLEPIYKEHVIGHADIKEIFRVPKVGAVAGCKVTDGHIERNADVRLLRDDVVVFTGKIATLRRFKEDAKEVQSGYECGIGLENFQDIKPGDVFEVYQIEELQAEL